VIKVGLPLPRHRVSLAYVGSLLQATDVQGTVTAAREWTPYGVAIGGAQPGLGYAGEWFDADVDAQYLRARWYDVATGRFTSEDVWEGDYQQPQSIHSYVYARNNAINLVDPSGLFCGYPQYTSVSDCQKFILELSSKILVGRLQGLSDYQIMRELAEHYSGIRSEYALEFGLDALGRHWDIVIGGIPAYYNPPFPHPAFRHLPGWELWGTDWDPRKKAASLTEMDEYGFKGLYWNNTHHYFADFYIACEFGATPEVLVNTAMEIRQYFSRENTLIESASDMAIGLVAARHAKIVREQGIEILPTLLYEEVCIKNWRELIQEYLLDRTFRGHYE
jgi:RHS repeat-associated protein